MAPSHPPNSTAAPRYARPFVAVFLAIVVACPLAGQNVWPFSSWRLFSNRVSNTQSRWESVAVDSTNRERPYRIAIPPNGYRGFGIAMARFASQPTTRRNGLCRSWMRGATKEFGGTTRLIRIYHLEWLLSQRRGDRSAPPHRNLAWICSPTGAHAVR